MRIFIAVVICSQPRILSDEHDADASLAVHSEYKIFRLSWNHIGNDVAVLDLYGQILVFTILIALNRLTVVRRCISDPEDNLGAVVGYVWLNIERMIFSRLLVKRLMLIIVIFFALLQICNNENRPSPNGVKHVTWRLQCLGWLDHPRASTLQLLNSEGSSGLTIRQVFYSLYGV